MERRTKYKDAETLSTVAFQKKYTFKATLCGLALLLAFLVLFPPAVEVTVAASTDQGPPPLVTVVDVVAKDVNPQKEYVGHVEAIQVVDVQARVGGLLEKVSFKEGSKVRVNDPLYLIEQAPYRARAVAAKARVRKAQANLARANSYLERIQAVRTGAVSATDLESAEADQLEASAELEEAQSALTLAELDLSYTRISAPISGRIGATALTAGNLCGPTSGPLARIVQTDPIRVRYSVSENDLLAIKMVLDDSSSQNEKDLLKPQIRLPDGEILKLSGQIDFIDNVVDAGTGTINVRVVFDNPEGLLLPGQYVTVLMSQKVVEMSPVIPQSAVLEDREGRYVLVVNAQNQVEQRRIKTGALSGVLWAVDSGLTVGESVIVQGLQKVQPGQTVQTMVAGEAKRNDQ